MLIFLILIECRFPKSFNFLVPFLKVTITILLCYYNNYAFFQIIESCSTFFFHYFQ